MNYIFGDKNKTYKILFLSISIAIITGLLIGILTPLYGLAVLILLLFISLSIKNIYNGIIFWVLTGGIIAVPIYNIRNGSIYLGIVILSLLFLIWIVLSLEKGEFGIVKSSLFWPLTIFIIIIILASIKGEILYDPDTNRGQRFILAHMFASICLIFSIITPFLIQRFFKTIEQINVLYLSIIFLGLLLGIPKLFNLTIIPIFEWNPMIQSYSLSLIFASLLFMPNLYLWKKMIFVIFIIYVLFFFIIKQMFFTNVEGQWLAGWIAMSIPLIFITYHKSKKWSIYIILLFLVLLFIMANKQIDDIFHEANKQRDFDRFVMWGSSIRLWLKNVVLGIGPGNYADYSFAYAPEGFKYTSAHSQYFQILTELGGLGMLCFFWIITKIILLGNYIIRTTRDIFIKMYIIGVMGAVYGQLVSGVFADYILPSYYNGAVENFQVTVYFWILVGSMMAVEQIVKKEGEKVKVSTTNTN